MTLIVRTDSSTAIGTGHAMRCLALAQGWQRRGGAVCFVMAEAPEALQDRLRNEGMGVRTVSVAPGSADDAATTRAIAEWEGAAAVVLDGYQFDAGYQHAAKAFAPKLLCIDDFGHAGHYCADFVLNQNLSADTALYGDREPQTKLLLGTRYALLRNEFLAWCGKKRASAGSVRRILVTMGGADNVNATLKVLQALSEINGRESEAVIVAGAGNPHLLALEEAVREQRKNGRDMSIRLERDVKDMAALMASSDLAVSAAGSSCWELAFMGVPAILMVLADNQQPLAVGMQREGAAKDLGWHEEVTSEAIAREVVQLLEDAGGRSRMKACGQRLVDGEGVDEVLMRLEGARFGLRRAREEDCEIVWKWANDPVAREFSFATDAIQWERHVDWFCAKLTDEHCTLFIATDDDARPVGQVRFDVEADSATISVSVDRAFRGRGCGREIIQTASERMLAGGSLREIRAYVKQGNDLSLRAFRRAGFEDAGTTMIEGAKAHRMTLRRSGRL